MSPPNIDTGNILMGRNMKSLKLHSMSDYGQNSYEDVIPPSVNYYSINTYRDYIQIPKKLFTKQSNYKTDLIKKYAKYM